MWSLLIFSRRKAHYSMFFFCCVEPKLHCLCADLVIRLHFFFFEEKWKFSLLLLWVWQQRAGLPLRLYLLRTGARSRSAAAFTAQVRVGGPWLLVRSPKFSRGPHLRPPHIHCHMAPVPRRVWSILRPATCTPACHPTLCLFLSHNELKNSCTHNPLLCNVCFPSSLSFGQI